MSHTVAIVYNGSIIISDQMKSKLILENLVIFEMSIFQLTSIPVNQEDSPTSSKIIRTRFHAAGIIRTITSSLIIPGSKSGISGIPEQARDGYICIFVLKNL